MFFSTVTQYLSGTTLTFRSRRTRADSNRSITRALYSMAPDCLPAPILLSPGLGSAPAIVLYDSRFISLVAIAICLCLDA